MKTDTSEKGLEDLIVAGLTNSFDGTIEGGAIHDGTAGYGKGAGSSDHPTTIAATKQWTWLS